MSVNLDMENGTESIHACFPPETDGHSGSAHDELREGTKHSRDSTSSGCFGWILKCFCVKKCLGIDEDSDDENYPETTGDGTKHSRDCSTGGCFEWIRRWVREKVSRKSKIDPKSPATGDGVKTANDEGDCFSVTNEDEQRGFSTDADYTQHERETPCSVLDVELGLKGAEEEQEEAENEVSGEGENAQTLSLQASELKEMEASNASAEQVSQNSEIAPNSPATGDGMNKANDEDDCASVRNEGDQRGFSTDVDYTLQEREMHCSVLAVELGLKGAEEEQEEAENEVSGEGENAQTLSLQASELKEMEPPNATEEEVQTELGMPKIDRQMKRLERDNRRLRKILINLKEERGQNLDEEFEPLSIQDAPCQKKYMRRIKKQSLKMVDLINRLRAVSQNSEIAPNSPATGDGMNKDNASVRNEDSHTAQCSTGDQPGLSPEADFTLHERETPCSVLAVELGLKGAEEEQEEAENEVSGEGENAHTLSLQASALKEMEPSNATEEEVQTELGLRKTDRQMKKLESENRRLRKILINLKKERGQKLDEEFQPLNMQDALCQKNYMKRIKRQSRKMDDLIKRLRAEQQLDI